MPRPIGYRRGCPPTAGLVSRGSGDCRAAPSQAAPAGASRRAARPHGGGAAEKRRCVHARPGAGRAVEAARRWRVSAGADPEREQRDGQRPGRSGRGELQRRPRGRRPTSRRKGGGPQLWVRRVMQPHAYPRLENSASQIAVTVGYCQALGSSVNSTRIKFKVQHEHEPKADRRNTPPLSERVRHQHLLGLIARHQWQMSCLFLDVVRVRATAC